MSVEAILQARADDLLRQIQRRHGPGDLAFVAVVCDNCRRSEQAPSVPQLAQKIEGWYLDDQVGREIDYCANCREKVL